MRNTKLLIIFSIITFIVVLVVLNSVVFSVKYVDVYCYNADDAEFNAKVLEASQVKRGGNIFFVNEAEILERIDQGVLESMPINVERKFPNRVQLNVVKRIPHSYVAVGNEFAVLDSAGKVIDVTTSEGLAVHEYIASDNVQYKLIELRLSGEVTAELGKTLVSSEPNEIIVYTSLLYAFARVDYRSFDVISLLEYIDLTQIKSELITAETKAYDSTKGTLFRILGTGNLNDKVHKAVTAFLRTDKARTNHEITVSTGEPAIKERD